MPSRHAHAHALAPCPCPFPWQSADRGLVGGEAIEASVPSPAPVIRPRRPCPRPTINVWGHGPPAVVLGLTRCERNGIGCGAGPRARALGRAVGRGDGQGTTARVGASLGTAVSRCAPACGWHWHLQGAWTSLFGDGDRVRSFAWRKDRTMREKVQFITSPSPSAASIRRGAATARRGARGTHH